MTRKIGPIPSGIFNRPIDEPAGLEWFSNLIVLVEAQGAAVADLNQTITNPPTQAEVQDISDKIDELLAALRTAKIIEE